MLNMSNSKTIAERCKALRIRLNALQIDLDSFRKLWEDSDRQDPEYGSAVKSCKRAIRKAELEMTDLLASEVA